MTRSGDEAERLAARYLERKGLTLVQSNYRCRLGEIDLILRDRATLVFVEVRLRRNPDFGGAAASVTAAKRRRLLRAARHYLATLPATPACRFDVVTVEGAAGDRVSWLRDAFGE